MLGVFCAMPWLASACGSSEGGNGNAGSSAGQSASGSGGMHAAGVAGAAAGTANGGSAATGGSMSEAGAQQADAGEGGEVGANGGAGGKPPAEAGASGADDFVAAPHPAFPLVTAHGGPVLEHIQLAPIYFGDDPLQSELESFNAWVVTSDYWKRIGADYGVFTGSHLPATRFDNVPADASTDVKIASWLAARIGDGSVPVPSSDTVFVLFFPSGTTIGVMSDVGTGTSCAQFAGLHESTNVASSAFTGQAHFVIIPRCSYSPGDELMIATNVATHEYIESATNPLLDRPAWQMDNGVGQPLEAWGMLDGPDVGDLCENQSYDVVDGFTVQDIWSNSAAQSGNDPCQPSDSNHPFFSVGAEQTIYHAQPGSTVTVHAVAWSNKPAPDWTIGVNWGYVPASDFDGQAQLSRTVVNNGDDVTATITIPANPPVQNGRSVYRFTIDSIDPINPNFDHPWPFMIVVP